MDLGVLHGLEPQPILNFSELCINSLSVKWANNSCYFMSQIGVKNKQENVH